MFFKQLFSESGAASWSRFGSFLALVGCLTWDSCYVYWTHKLPDSLYEQACFIGALYGLGKAGQTVQSFSPRAGEITK